MVSLAILAGGRSERMGRDKAILPFLGVTFVQRVLNRLAGLATETIIVGPDSEDHQKFGLRIVPDLIAGRGALGGLYTALYSATNPIVIVVACDMPFVNRELLRKQKDILQKENMDVIVPRSEGGLEPLHAIYRRDVCIPAVQRAIRDGEKRLISWFPYVQVRIMERDEMDLYDPYRLAFMNINTPDELMQAEQIENMNINRT
jgi:molybdopterin-guanine dinucleotide biosynthesis protein A